MRPSSRVALSEAFCTDLGYPPIACLVLSLLPTAAARSSEGAKGSGAASRGDRSMSARARQPRDGEGLRRYRGSAPTGVLIGGWRADVGAKALSRQGGVM
jgi:hypothetical protein